MRIYANKGEASKLAFALEVATKCLDWYESYFNIAYPLKKCDLIGIPDFTGGAMENWGLITFRSSLGLQVFSEIFINPTCNFNEILSLCFQFQLEIRFQVQIFNQVPHVLYICFVCKKFQLHGKYE